MTYVTIPNEFAPTPSRIFVRGNEVPREVGSIRESAPTEACLDVGRPRLQTARFELLEDRIIVASHNDLHVHPDGSRFPGDARGVAERQIHTYNDPIHSPDTQPVCVSEQTIRAHTKT